MYKTILLVYFCSIRRTLYYNTKKEKTHTRVEVQTRKRISNQAKEAQTKQKQSNQAKTVKPATATPAAIASTNTRQSTHPQTKKKCLTVPKTNQPSE